FAMPASTPRSPTTPRAMPPSTATASSCSARSSKKFSTATPAKAERRPERSYQILLPNLPQRLQRRLRLVACGEQSAVRKEMRRRVRQLIPQNHLHRRLRDQQRHVTLDPLPL